MGRIQLSHSYRATATEETKSSWYFLIDLRKSKNEFTLEQTSGFEPGTRGSEIQRPCPVFINIKQTLHYKDYKVAIE